MNLKKKISTKLSKNPDIEILFFDESRFGTHSKLGHGWFKKGSRTQIKINMGFKNFYVYSAVNSISGNNYSLTMPYVNTDCMNIFLSRLAMSLKQKRCLLIMDGASWHRSYRLKVPANIEIAYLPAYSPELNPVERLWNYLKAHTIKNKFYTSLNKLENSVCAFLNNMTKDNFKHICACSYL
jgi:transposase